LNLAPTKCEGNAVSGAEDYDLKYAQKKVGPFLALQEMNFMENHHPA
jgi:hypothetical protein